MWPGQVPSSKTSPILLYFRSASDSEPNAGLIFPVEHSGQLLQTACIYRRLKKDLARRCRQRAPRRFFALNDRALEARRFVR